MNKIKDSRAIHILLERTNSVVIPGFQGIPIGNVFGFFWHSLSRGIIFHRAAAMTYRIVFSLIPLLMTLFATISFLGDKIRLQLLDFIQSFVPNYVWPAISNMIDGVINHHNGTLLSFSLIFSIITVVAALNACINILNTTYYKSSKRKFIKQLRVVGMLLLFWFVIIMVAISVFIGAATWIQHIDTQVVHSPGLKIATIQIFKWLVLFTLAYLFISIFYYLAPTNHKHYTFFSAGSTFATIMLMLVLLVINFYFANFGNYNALYGSLGAIFAIMTWIYFDAIFILVGYDLNVSIAQAKQMSLRHTENTNEK